MMSFPRDMVVNVHCPGQPVFAGKINSAYANCGSKGTVQTVSDLIGLPINYLITVNFRGFKKIVNRLGGVWIDVDRRYFNNNAGLCRRSATRRSTSSPATSSSPAGARSTTSATGTPTPTSSASRASSSS